ncbi:MAG: hypothetical protein AB8I08_12755 [Sandaracinaceae bacterium]
MRRLGFLLMLWMLGASASVSAQEDAGTEDVSTDTPEAVETDTDPSDMAAEGVDASPEEANAPDMDADPAEEVPEGEGDPALDEVTEAGLDQLMLMVRPLSDETSEEGETLEQLSAEGLTELESVARSREDAAVPEPPAAGEVGEIPFWGNPRLFVSGILDVGFLFLQPRFHAGYGVPHELWLGLELDPIISGSGIGVYGGIRGEIPYADLRIGARYRFNWTRSFLESLDGYDHIQLRDRVGPNANYLSAEAQLSFDIPIESTDLVGEITATYVVPFEEGFSIYEDTLRIIVVAPSWIWSVGIGWRFSFGPNEAFSIEPGVELTHLVGRDAALGAPAGAASQEAPFVLRAGLRASIRMWPDLSVRLTAMPAIVSPDSLGGAGGHSFLLGIRYRWATDAPRYGDDG